VLSDTTGREASQGGSRVGVTRVLGTSSAGVLGVGEMDVCRHYISELVTDLQQESGAVDAFVRVCVHCLARLTSSSRTIVSLMWLTILRCVTDAVVLFRGCVAPCRIMFLSLSSLVSSSS